MKKTLLSMETYTSNMFGGRINHPAYDLRVLLAPNEFLAGPTLYTIKPVAGDHAGFCVVYEGIDGEQGICGNHPDYPIPEWLQKHVVS